MDSNFLKKVGEVLVEIFVLLHKGGFMMLSDGIWECKHNDIAFGIFAIVSAIVVIASIVAIDLLVICAICYVCERISIKIRTKEVEYHKVIGKVTSKEYKEEHTTYTWTGKFFVPRHHPKEYNVDVEYQGVLGTFNSEKLYRKHKKGSPIKVVLVIKYDKHDKIIEETLELPE